MNESILDRQGSIKTGYVVLFLGFFFLCYLLPLGAMDLLIPDETRYGEIPREMIAGGDWIVPRIDGVRYFEKPVLGYWVHAGSLMLFGENNFGVRFPSAAAAGLSALLVFVLVFRVLRRNAEDAWFGAALAALVFLSCIEVFAVGNTAVLDNLLSLFLTGSIAAFFFASEVDRGSRKEKGLLVTAGISCGLAFLTKGFLAFAVPVLTLAPYLAWQRRWGDILRMGWLPVVCAILAALPWSIWIHLREPDFWNYFFWEEHVRRFFAGDAQHKESFWSFTLAAPVLFFPWTLAVPAAVHGLVRRISEPGLVGRMIRLSLCWLVLPFVFFSLSSGKLFTYLLPCFPPFAVLMSFGLSHVFEKKWPGRLFQWAIAACAVIFALVLPALAYVQFVGLGGDRIYSQSWKAMLAVDGLFFYILLCVWALRIPGTRSKILAFAMAPLLLYVGAHFIVPDSAIESKSPGPLLERNRRLVGEDAVILSDQDTIRAVCWYLKRNDVYMLGDPGELTYGFGYEDAAGRLLDMQSAAELILRNPGRVVLVGRMMKHPQWREQLPEPVFRDTSGPRGYEFWEY